MKSFWACPSPTMTGNYHTSDLLHRLFAWTGRYTNGSGRAIR